MRPCFLTVASVEDDLNNVRLTSVKVFNSLPVSLSFLSESQLSFQAALFLSLNLCSDFDYSEDFASLQ